MRLAMEAREVESKLSTRLLYTARKKSHDYKKHDSVRSFKYYFSIVANSSDIGIVPSRFIFKKLVLRSCLMHNNPSADPDLLPKVTFRSTMTALVNTLFVHRNNSTRRLEACTLPTGIKKKHPHLNSYQPIKSGETSQQCGAAEYPCAEFRHK